MPLTPVKEHFFVRYLHSGFYEAAAQIECDSSEHFWTRNIIKETMRQRNVTGRFLTDFDIPVGYVVMEHRSQDGEVCVLNLVVRSDYRRRGLGTILMDGAVSLAKAKRAPIITMEVRESNLAAQLFLKATDFWAIGTAKDYFEDHHYDGVEKEDAYCFERKIQVDLAP